MTKFTWIKILVLCCLGAYMVALSLVNILDKSSPSNTISAQSRWSNLDSEQKKLETEVAPLNEKNVDAARRLVAIYAQRNSFDQAEALAEKIAHLPIEHSSSDLETLATVERQKGDYRKCLNLLEIIAKIDEGDVKKTAKDQINIGTIYYLTGLSSKDDLERRKNFLKAKDFFEKARTSLRKTDDETKNSSELKALEENENLNTRELRALGENES